MKAFSTWSADTDAHFTDRCVVAFDLDDTLTLHGALPGKVVLALEKAQAAGWLCVLVSGRSAGWVDALIKLMPFDAVVGENGALLAYWPNRKSKRGPREEATKRFWSPEGYGPRPPNGLQDRFAEARHRIFARVPRARVASDQPYRLYDLAIDFAEEVDPPLGLDAAELIREDFEALGATAKISSIHVNGWWGRFTKVDGLRKLVEGHYGLSLEKHLLYSGDSPNDGPLFEAAGLSVGVANVRQYQGSTGFVAPDFVTQGESAEGAMEILERICRR